MRIILSFIILISVANPITNLLISDDDFTNYNEFPLRAYERTFGSRLSKERIGLMYSTPRYYGFNPLVLFVLAQRESGQFTERPSRGIEDYFLGAWIHYDAARKTNTFKPFYRQVWLASYRLNYWYSLAETNRYSVWLYDNRRNNTMSNRSTYALFKYTPLHRLPLEFSGRVDYFGNFTFPTIYTQFHAMLCKATNP
jgi:hypothetical protein